MYVGTKVNMVKRNWQHTKVALVLKDRELNSSSFLNSRIFRMYVKTVLAKAFFESLESHRRDVSNSGCVSSLFLSTISVFVM